MKRHPRIWSAVCAVSLTVPLLMPARAGTVAYWRFEEGPADALITHNSGVDGVWSEDIPDSSGNGNGLSAWSGGAWANEYYRSDVPAAIIPSTGAANNFSIRNAGTYPGLWNESLATWTPAQWTIEACFKPETGGYRTIVGRDSRGAATQGTPAGDSALYFQIRPDNQVAVIFQDVAGYSHAAISANGLIQGFPNSTDPNGLTGRWYAMAATSDGATLSLYLNDLTAGTGYQLVAETDLTLSGSPDTAFTPGIGSGGDWSAGNFSVMRGMWDGGHADRAYGFIDEVRLSDTALAPTQFLFAVVGDTEVRGTVTDSFTGAPVAGATVTAGTRNTTTDSAGKYFMFSKAGETVAFSVTSPFGETSYTGTVTFPATGFVTKDVQIFTRPHVDLTTANGFAWKIAVNTGGTVDYSAETVDETGWLDQAVPANAKAASVVDDAYIWYRLHFDLPAGFLTALPGRLALLNVPGIDDTDIIWLNGTKIGETGGMPNPPLDVQPAGHINPPEGGILEMAPGAYSDWTSARNYYFPAGLLKATGNVIAVKVWDLNGGAGITTAPTLQIAKPTGTISGTVMAAGTPVAGFRVTAMNEAGASSDTALTDATGAFDLKHVATGITLVGAVKPGYNAVAIPVGNIIEGGAVNGLAIATTAVTGGAAAPVYDDFNGSGTAWEAKWTAQSLESLDPLNAPIITMPGVDAATRAEIPGSITIDGGLGVRGALLSKATLSKYASLVSAKLVSATSPAEPTGTTPNVILYISGQGVPADQWAYTNQVEIDLEGYQTQGGNQRVRAMIWAGTALVNRTNLPVPVPLERLSDVTPANPLDLAIARTGSYYDCYIGGIRVYSCYANVMPDHRFAVYSYQAASPTTTWDEVLASGLSATTPVPGDLSGNGILDASDTLIALRIAGGLVTATPEQKTTGNVAGGDNAISILDALRLHHAANGRPL